MKNRIPFDSGMNSGACRSSSNSFHRCSGGIVRSALVGVIFLGALLALLWMAFFRFAMERELMVRTGFATSIERLFCNPMSGRMRADAITFRNPKGFPDTEFMRLSEVDLAIKPLTIRSNLISVPELALVVDQLSLVVTHTGQMNTRVFSDALDGANESESDHPSDRPTQEFEIEHLSITIKEVDIEDLRSGTLFVRRYRPGVHREFRNVTDFDEVVRTLLGDLLQAGLGSYAPGVLAVIPSRLAGPAGPVFLQGDERLKATMDSVIELLKNRFETAPEDP
jgi:hypothetical protein